MPGENAEAIVRKYYEKATQGDERTIDELLSENFVLHSPISDEPIRGIDGYKAMMAAYRAATPEMKVKVEDLKVEGDTVVTRWSARFKHTGQFEDHSPTGKSGDVTGSDRIRIVEGKIVEIHNAVDLAAVERQVGFEPKLKKH
jgi:steroid delta-isomerase-like uncharacterized protein